MSVEGETISRGDEFLKRREEDDVINTKKIHSGRVNLFCEDTVEALLEPVLRVLLGDTVRVANSGSASLSAGDAVTRAAHDTVEVGTEDLQSRSG